MARDDDLVFCGVVVDASSGCDRFQNQAIQTSLLLERDSYSVCLSSLIGHHDLDGGVGGVNPHHSGIKKINCQHIHPYHH